MEHYRKLFKKKIGLDLLNDKAVQKLRTEIERAKIKQSTDLEAEIKIESSYSNKTLITSELTRESLDRLNYDRIITIINMINKVIKDSKNVTLDEIILTGGSSKIPKLKAMIQNFFKTKRLNTQMNAQSVAFGASICSFKFYGNRISFSLGFEKKYATFSKIIHKGSILPLKGSSLVKNSAKKKEINIRVFKGEKTIAQDNKFIFSKTYYSTSFISIRESCILEIEFDVDSFGILDISVQMIIYSEKGERRKSSLNYTQDKSYKYLYLVLFLLFSLFNVKNMQKFLLSPLPKRKANEVFHCYYNYTRKFNKLS